MPQIRSNSSSKQKPNTAPLQEQAFTLRPSMQKTVHISHSFGSAPPEKMHVKSDPVVIGTRGTVGSLVMQEIDYFRRLELGDESNSRKSSHQLADLPSTSEFFKPKLDSVVTIPRKKDRGSKRFIPSMCSVVEVAESNQPNSLYGFAYRKLEADVKRLQP